MARTESYGLYYDEDPGTSISTWVHEVAGSATSNMGKIDAALASKAAKSSLLEGVLPASGWTGDKAPYSQTVQVTGATASQHGIVSWPMTATLEQRNATRDGCVTAVGQGDGSITFSADGVKPEVDIPFIVIILG